MTVLQHQPPPDWKIKRLKHVASLQSGVGITSESIEDEGHFPVYGGNGLRGFATAYTHDGQFVLIGRQGALCGNVHLVDGKFWASEHAVVGTFYAGDSPRWARHVFEHMSLGQYSIASAQPGLAVDRIKELPIAVPPVEVQLAIASYLDAETKRIDVLIEEKTRLLTLVDELHQSRVTEVLREGLHRDRKSALTGDWRVPSIPEGWSLVKWKHIGRFKAGAGFPVDLQGQEGKPYPFFKVKDISMADAKGVMSIADSTVDDEDAARLGASILRPGSVVFAKVGAALLLSRFRILGCACCIDNNMMAFSIDPELAIPRYVLHAMSQFNLGDVANPGTVPSLNERQVRDLPIALPPLEEQSEIASELDFLAEEVHQTREHVCREISLLKELRSSTISDAVLGRIDVSTDAKN